MGRELVNGASQQSETLSEALERMLPVYMAYGMTPDEYWNGDCMLAKAYREADEIKKRRRNQELWLQGMYVYEAILDCAPLLNPFEKHPKPKPYSAAPYPITPQEVREQAQKKRIAECEKAKAAMHAWANKVNAQIAAREAEEVKATNG